MFINITTLCEAQKDYVIKTALEILEMKHRRGEQIHTPEDVKAWLRIKTQGYENEVFGIICLDNRHRIIKCTELFTGTVDGASVFPRVVVKHVLDCNASAVIFFHNHPSGEPTPSQADIKITQRLKDALALIDVRVLDHHVIGSHDVVSFSERGLL